jgi:YggT family protein
MNALNNLGSFFISVLFNLYIGAVMLRFLLAASRANFYNPISQFLVTITNPVLRPLRRMIPPMGKLDTAAIVLMVALKLIQLFLLFAFAGQEISLLSLLGLTIKSLLELLIYVYLFAVLIQAIMSWITPGAYSSQSDITSLLNSLTSPILKPLRQIVPMIGMIDITPLVAIILLNAALVLLRSF